MTDVRKHARSVAVTWVLREWLNMKYVCEVSDSNSGLDLFFKVDMVPQSRSKPIIKLSFVWMLLYVELALLTTWVITHPLIKHKIISYTYDGNTVFSRCFCSNDFCWSEPLGCVLAETATHCPHIDVISDHMINYNLNITLRQFVSDFYRLSSTMARILVCK